MGFKDLFGGKKKRPANARNATRRRTQRAGGGVDTGYLVDGVFYLDDGTCPSASDYAAPAVTDTSTGSNGSYGGSDYGDGGRSSYSSGGSDYSGGGSSYSSGDSGYSSGGGYSSSSDSGSSSSSSSSSSDSGSY